MKDKIRRGRLYDFYGELLSEHKRKIFELYVIDDLSLTEIADEMDMTKQGVSNLIKRSTAAMEEYESALRLCERFERIEDRLDVIRRIAAENGLDEISALVDEISEEL